jgi:hypothetical protein
MKMTMMRKMMKIGMILMMKRKKRSDLLVLALLIIEAVKQRLNQMKMKMTKRKMLLRLLGKILFMFQNL